MIVSSENITKYAFLCFIPIVMLVYYMEMRGITYTHSLFLIPLFFVLGVKAINIYKSTSRDVFSSLLFYYVLYNILSIIWYAINGVPLVCYKEGIFISVLAIMFAFLGYKYKYSYQFYTIFLYSCAVCYIIGYYLYFVRPQYYVDFITNVAYGGSSNMAEAAMNSSDVLNAYRYSSFFSNNYRIAYFCIPSFVLSLYFYTSYRINKKIMLSIAIISFVTSIICFQRISQAFAVISLGFFIYYWRKINLTGMIVKILLLSVVMLALFSLVTHFDALAQFDEMISQQLERFNIGSAMSERTNQFDIGRDTSFTFVFGLGLGSCGYPVLPYGLKGVYDCEYVKMFYELGLVGCIIFAILMIKTIKRGYANISQNFAEFLIVIYFLAAGIGSDSLSMYVSDIIFWYAVGRIWSQNKVKNQFVKL